MYLLSLGSYKLLLFWFISLVYPSRYLFTFLQTNKVSQSHNTHNIGRYLTVYPHSNSISETVGFGYSETTENCLASVENYLMNIICSNRLNTRLFEFESIKGVLSRFDIKWNKVLSKVVVTYLTFSLFVSGYSLGCAQHSIGQKLNDENETEKTARQYPISTKLTIFSGPSTLKSVTF